jgi:hypothetical protein
MHGHQPAFAIGVLPQSGGMVHNLRVDFHDLSFGGRYHLGFHPVAVEGDELLPLRDPLARLGEFDFLNFAQKGGSKFIGADAHEVLALSDEPAMPRVIGNVLGNLKAIDKVSAERGRDHLGRFHRHGGHRFAPIQEVIQHDKNQEKR